MTTLSACLNPAGNDVLIIMGFIRLKEIWLQKHHQGFYVVVVDDNRYAVLDHVMGRVFTYNSLVSFFMFWAIGEVIGSFRDPVAIDCIGDHFLVLNRAGD